MKSLSLFLRKCRAPSLKWAVILVFFTAHTLNASTNIPIDDPVYRDIDKLVAANLVKDIIYGQRPWSRREIARIISVAKKSEQDNLQLIGLDDKYVELSLIAQDILERLSHEYREELIEIGDTEGEVSTFIVKPLEQVSLDYTFLDSPYRQVPFNNNLGSIDAAVNPLVAYREGRHSVDGNTLGLETTHRVRISKYFSVYARPRFELLGPRGSEVESKFYVQQLYGNFTYKKFNLEVGRDSLIWGQGEHGGLLLTNNARALDQIKISSESPFFFPGFLKYLGPSKATLFVANLGPEREYPYSFLTGFKLSMKPTSFLEIGASQIVIMGGDGSPRGSFWDYLGEFFAVRPGVGFTPSDINNTNGINLSDRLMGADFRLSFPQLSNTQIYGEAFTEACCGVFKILYGYYGGLYAPVFLSNDVSLRLEYSHFPGVFYRHEPFVTGKALNKNFLGHHGGPDSDVVLAELRSIISDIWQNKFSFAYEVYKGDIYSGVDGTIDSTYASTVSLRERRYRVMETLTYSKSFYTIENSLGFEHLNNFNFSADQRRANFIYGLKLTFRP